MLSLGFQLACCSCSCLACQGPDSFVRSLFYQSCSALDLAVDGNPRMSLAFVLCLVVMKDSGWGGEKRG